MGKNAFIKVACFLLYFLLISLDVKAESIHQWEVYTISFASRNVYANPYLDIPVSGDNDLLKVVFEGVSGDALGKTITLVGFWNGGDEWCVNFASPYTGKWKYSSVSSDKGLDNKKGSIEVLPWSEEEKAQNPTRHGFLQVRRSGENANHYFEYADGQPFLWIGDTWWFWTNKKIYFETFKKLVDNRAEKGFNIGQLFIPGNHRNGSLLDTTYTILDTEHAKRVEEMVRYANSKGITVWIHGWWSRKDLNITAGEEKVQRWWRYLVHRFSAYNVIWVGAGEYNMFVNGGFTLDFWKDLGQGIKHDDPYNHLYGLHSTPPTWPGGLGAPQWSTGKYLHNDPGLDYNQSQVGHGRYKNELIPFIVNKDYARTPTKPIVVTESWYEFVEGNPTGMDIRFAAWSAILSGAAGSSYGGGHVWRANTPEAPNNDGSTWPVEMGFERTTYDYEGAVSMKHVADFFKNIEWWKMKPHPELIEDYPQPLCLAIPGSEYIIYLRYGGIVKLHMNAVEATGEYTFKWYNPATGEWTEPNTIQGDSLLIFNSPEAYPHYQELKDWLLYIYKK